MVADSAEKGNFTQFRLKIMNTCPSKPRCQNIPHQPTTSYQIIWYIVHIFSTNNQNDKIHTHSLRADSCVGKEMDTMGQKIILARLELTAGQK